MPLSVVLTEFGADASGQAHVATEELSLRYDESMIAPSSAAADKNKGAAPQLDNGNASSSTSWTVILLSVTAMGAAAFIGGRTYLRYTVRKSHRERVREFIDDETAVSPGLQQIAALQKNGSKKKGYTDVGSVDEGQLEGGGMELGNYA